MYRNYFRNYRPFSLIIFRSVYRILIPAHCYLIEDFNLHECKKDNTHKAHFKHLSDIIFLAKMIVYRPREQCIVSGHRSRKNTR